MRTFIRKLVAESKRFLAFLKAHDIAAWVVACILSLAYLLFGPHRVLESLVIFIFTVTVGTGLGLVVAMPYVSVRKAGGWIHRNAVSLAGRVPRLPPSPFHQADQLLRWTAIVCGLACLLVATFHTGHGVFHGALFFVALAVPCTLTYTYGIRPLEIHRLYAEHHT